MKKIISILMTSALLFCLAACGGNVDNENTPASAKQSGKQTAVPAEGQSNTGEPSEIPAPESDPAEAGSKSLVAYFSWSGNTENVAEAIAEQTGSDIFEIIPAMPYSDDYDTVVDLAQEEQQNGARPEITGSIENISEYDVIYVGYPNWWGDMPMILYTFFDSYDLSGKTIAPFCTSGGSGLSGTVSEIKELEPSATVTDGLHIGSSSASNPDHAVSEWLSEIGLTK